MLQVTGRGRLGRLAAVHPSGSGSHSRAEPSSPGEPRSLPTPVIVGKLVPPEAPAGTIVRDRLLQQLSADTRLLFVVAPAGCGKTVAARQIAEADARRFAWLNIDCLDDDPTTFWVHLIHALRWAEPCIDGEPERLLHERGFADPAFLVMLISQLEVAGTPAVFVLDGVSQLSDHSVLSGLALLVDRVGDLVRFVMVGRSFPELPIGRWRAHGWVHELGERELRFTDDEAAAAVAALPELDVDLHHVAALNARVEGWPAGLVLAAHSVSGAAHPALAVEQLVGSERLFREYFASEMLDHLADAERATAMSLAVLEQYDAEICFDLLGVDAMQVAHDLHRVHGFLAHHDAATGMVRLHPMLREMLEEELRRRDPDLRRTLHREAAGWYRDRDDLSSAHRHLRRLGDHQAAAELVIQPVLSLVNRGDRRGLAQLKRLLPREMRATDASFAFDVAVAWLFIGGLDEATFWCERGEQLMAQHDPAMQQRLHSVRGMIALLRGEVAVGERHVAAFELAEHAGPVGPLEDRFATTAARVMLASGRLDDAARWVERAAQIAQPAVIAEVNVPTLAAWLALERGRLTRATELAEAACERAEELGVRPHHGASDAMVVSGWCRLAVGDLAGATLRADAASIDAEILGVPWNRIRSAVLAAQTRRLGGAPRAALAVLHDLRTDLGAAGDKRRAEAHLIDEVAVVEGLAFVDCGDLTGARSRIELLPTGVRRRLLTARVAVRDGAREADVEEAMGDRRGWSLQRQLLAEVLLTAAAAGAGEASVQRMSAVVRDAAATGWVLPFLGHGPVVDELLRELPLATLHPALARAMASLSSGRPVTAGHDRLTPRELRLLHFLPTHLSYAEIGERLFISVNTVKTNLKTLYRKLGATTRAEAVELAAAAGLVGLAVEEPAKREPTVTAPLR